MNDSSVVHVLVHDVGRSQVRYENSKFLRLLLLSSGVTRIGLLLDRPRPLCNRSRVWLQMVHVDGNAVKIGGAQIYSCIVMSDFLTALAGEW